MSASDERRAGTAPAGRLPDFFIVGHPKCGTTALYEMLRRHPQIYMPDFKEPWFFSDDMRPRFQPKRSGTAPETISDYLRLFAAARPEQHVGEASSSYLRSRRAAERIAAVRPDARIIAIVREPASFLRSLHHQMLLDHVETKKDLRVAVSLEQLRREGKRIPRRSHLPQMLMYSDHVRYVEQLRRYQAVFSPEQILVLVYDDFRSDNAGTLALVQRFLDVTDDDRLELLDANSSSKRMRSQHLDDLLSTVAVGRGPVSRTVKTAAKAVTSDELRTKTLKLMRGKVVHGKPRPPDEELMRELRVRFTGEVVALSEYLDRDLVRLWGYDELV
jgi:Sulfotransferase domain